MSAAVMTLRACLSALTDAFDRRGAEDTIRIAPETLGVAVDSRLDDVDVRRVGSGHPVPPPNGLFEWQVRRDFVRSLAASPLKTRLGATLGGARTRRRFEVVLGSSRDAHVRGAFVRFRRRRLRAYAARVIRFVIAAHVNIGFRSGSPFDIARW